MSAFHRTKRYTMKKDAASSTLAKILSSVEKNSNTPIDKMLKKRVNAAKGYSRYLTAVKIMLAFTICVPLIFVFTANAKGVDTKADISVGDYYVQDGYLYIDLDGPFIDFTSVYAVTASGSTVFPVDFNSGTGMVSFPYDETEWNIYVSDLNSETVHMLLTPPTF
ncbi:MAG: hypothetical protein IKS16_08795 [Lachnospiraceae bacterium]|nr:hypothetical protein [Lachnospiraceae bacterium]